ncbi:MAG: hypothetical protein RIA65_12040 [Woeseia sp.]
MFKTFIIGILLGLAAAAAASWVLPVANPHREPSLITVQPNGGNSELFQIRIPDDRIVAGGSSGNAPTPSSLVWPDLGIPAGLELELFKIRNRDDVVIGLASRISVSGQVEPAAVEWALHLPARGALYFPMTANSGDFRSGELRAGTREFLDRTGRLEERYVPDPVSPGQGRIELRSSLIGKPTNRPDGEQP